MIAYAISDPSTLRYGCFSSDISRLAASSDMLLYRDRDNPAYTVWAEFFVSEARRYSGLKIFLHNDPLLASKLGADGVHLSSGNFALIKEAKSLALTTIASTHSLEEALKAEKEGADMVTLSPVFSSPGKGDPLGPGKFASMAQRLEIPVIALGDVITREHISLCEQAGAHGFASIRYFSPVETSS